MSLLVRLGREILPIGRIDQVPSLELGVPIVLTRLYEIEGEAVRLGYRIAIAATRVTINFGI